MQSTIVIIGAIIRNHTSLKSTVHIEHECISVREVYSINVRVIIESKLSTIAAAICIAVYERVLTLSTVTL